MTKVRNLTIGDIRYLCCHNNDCNKCPIHEYHNARLCHLAIESTHLTDEDLEVEK